MIEWSQAAMHAHATTRNWIRYCEMKAANAINNRLAIK